MVFLWVTITSLTDEIISNARKTMGKLVDNIISLKIDEIETYEFPQNQLFGLERFAHDNKNFICMNPGAFNRISSKGKF